MPRRVLRSAELNLLTVPPGKPGKYGSRSFARASANLWNSLRGERAAWLFFLKIRFIEINKTIYRIVEMTDIRNTDSQNEI